MRLKEEKTLMIIGVLGVMIVFFTMLIEIANYKIDEWKTNLLFLQSEANDAFNNELKFITYANYLTFLDNPEPNFTPYTEQDHLSDKKYDNEFVAIWKQLSNKEISKRDYINKLFPLLAKNKIQFSNLYNQKKDKISDLYKNQPRIWDLIKKVCNLIRIVTIFCTAILYMLLYKSIGERVKGLNNS